MTTSERVLWIGGRSGAGKSTVARLLARRHGLRWYSCDTRTWEHRDRAIAAGDPAAIEWEQLTPQQRSALSTAEAIRLTIDRAPLVLADVAALPDAPAVVAEGTNILPSMVPAASPAVWLFADPTIRAIRTDQRGWGAGGDELDLIKERELRTELVEHAAAVIDTSADTDPSTTVREVEAMASGWLVAQPTARTRVERQALIRDGNAAIVTQYRRGLARSGNTGANPIRTYDCECGSPECTAFVERSLGSIPDPFDASADPLLAPGHS